MSDTSSADWKKLHENALVVDSHADSIVAYIMRGNLSFFGGERKVPWKGTIEFLRGAGDPRPGASDIQLNAATMSAGGIDVGVFRG